MLVMKSGEKPNLENYSVFFETLIRNELLDNLLNWIKETGAPIPDQRNVEFKNSK